MDGVYNWDVGHWLTGGGVVFKEVRTLPVLCLDGGREFSTPGGPLGGWVWEWDGDIANPLVPLGLKMAVCKEELAGSAGRTQTDPGREGVKGGRFQLVLLQIAKPAVFSVRQFITSVCFWCPVHFRFCFCNARLVSQCSICRSEWTRRRRQTKGSGRMCGDPPFSSFPLPSWAVPQPFV